MQLLLSKYWTKIFHVSYSIVNVGYMYMHKLEDLQRASCRSLASPIHFWLIKSWLYFSISLYIYFRDFQFRVQRSLAGCLVVLQSLSSQMNPIVRPLMDTVKKEINVQLQEQAAFSLSRLVQQCINRSPCPTPKIIKNLVTTLCADSAFTPNVVLEPKGGASSSASASSSNQLGRCSIIISILILSFIHSFFHSSIHPSIYLFIHIFIYLVSFCFVNYLFCIQQVQLFLYICISCNSSS